MGAESMEPGVPSLSRERALAELGERRFDLLVVGGGIVGAAIAAHAARAGLAVALVERADFGGATSSASSKLIHGGLRYLRLGDVALVREAHHERRALTNVVAPHLVHRTPFLLPLYEEGPFRPAFVQSGIVLYSVLARSRLNWLVAPERAKPARATAQDGRSPLVRPLRGRLDERRTPVPGERRRGRGGRCDGREPRGAGRPGADRDADHGRAGRARRRARDGFRARRGERDRPLGGRRPSARGSGRGHVGAAEQGRPRARRERRPGGRRPSPSRRTTSASASRCRGTG